MSQIQMPSCNHTQLDCYSFGVLLWVLLGWKLPFRNMQPMQVCVWGGGEGGREKTRSSCSLVVHVVSFDMVCTLTC